MEEDTGRMGETDGERVDALIASLSAIFPPDRLLSLPEQLRRYQKDLVSRESIMPLAAVVPSDRQQVIDTVRVCHELEIPFVARGAGSSLSGGALPVADGIVIHLKDLDRIVRFEPSDRIAVVEPGVINLHVTRAVERDNLYYAPDPSSEAFCTVGGNVAFNSGGVHCLKYGMTSNHVLGIEAVLADGEVVSIGGESFERVGPDLTGLFVGSEGLFGIALEATLRLTPQVESRSAVLAAYRSLGEAGNVVSDVIASGLLPGAIEIMDPLAIRVAEAVAHAGYPLDAGALLIVELEGEEAEVAEEFDRLLTIVGGSHAYETRTATDEKELATIWKGRKIAFTAIRKVSANYIIQDGVVPRSKLSEALSRIEVLGREYDIPIANVFHAGDGNLHPLILYEAEGCDADRDKAEELAGEIVRVCIEMEGSITGEHGVGLEKRAYLPEMFSSDDMAVMRRLRSAMDPKELANPGKMMTIGERVELVSARTEERTSEVERAPESLRELREAVLAFSRILPVGRQTKPSLSSGQSTATILRTTNLRGIVSYDPDEFTFTALAGTPIDEISEELSKHGQYLPFDPPLCSAGATIGGTVASGLSGPGSYRYGGLRNFILEVVFVDGNGTIVRGGSRVVKNAAGFDLPKLMVGSIGGLGVFGELTFKVFPLRRTTATVRRDFDSLPDAVNALGLLNTSSLSIESVELDPDTPELFVRVGGSEASVEGKVPRVSSILGGADRLDREEEDHYWESAREFGWAEDARFLAKVPMKPSAILDFDRAAAPLGLARKYANGGSIAWIASARDSGDTGSQLDDLLTKIGMSGVVLKGIAEPPLVGTHSGGAFLERVKASLDPTRRFRDYPHT